MLLQKVVWRTFTTFQKPAQVYNRSFLFKAWPSVSFFSTLNLDHAEKRKLAFSQVKDLKPRDMEIQLMTCKNVNDYHECFKTLVLFADVQGRHRLNKDKIQQFTVSVNQTLKYQSVTLGFLRHAVRFLERFNLLSNFDVNMLVKTILLKKRSFVEQQDDIIEILDNLAIHVKNNEDVRTILRELESAFKDKIEELKDRNLVNLYYHYLGYEHTKNPAFIEAVENELILRIDGFDQIQLVDSLKLFKLPADNQYYKSKIPSILEGDITQHLGKLTENEIVRVMKNLRNYEELSKAFCVEFENTIATKCSDLTLNTLLSALSFVTLKQFKLSSDIIYKIEIEILGRNVRNVNKFLVKDMTASDHYRSKDSLINNLFKYSFNSLDETLTKEKTSEPGTPAPDKQSLKTTIIKEIGEVKSPFELKLITNISMILKIERAEILNAVFQQLLVLKKSNELSLTYLSNFIHNLLELRYYIDFQKHQVLFDLLKESVRTRVHEANPATCLDLVKIFCRYTVYSASTEAFTEMLDSVVDKIIKEKYFYVGQERTDLLSHLAMSPQSCNRKLVEYIIRFFGPDSNKFYNKEVYFLNDRQLYLALYRIRAYIPDLDLSHSALQAVLEKGEQKFKEKAEWLKNKREESVILREIMRGLERERRENPNLSFKLAPVVDCYTTDFQITVKQGESESTAYVDVCDADHFHVNKKEMLVIDKLCKNKYLESKGYNYKVLLEEEWEKGEGRELLKIKLEEWFSKTAGAKK